jgi:hypothetical protein
MIRNAQATELRWMLKHIGCEETDVEFLDYMLQYEALSSAHIEAVHGIAGRPATSTSST